MAINERVITGTTAAAANGDAVSSAEQGLILHLDANDVDSYDGDGSVWYDISEHDVTIPLSDNADDLELHLNASDSTSYDPATGTTTWTDISGNSRNATLTSMGNSSFDIDNGGYFNVVATADYVTIPYNAALVPTSTGYTFEGWYNFDVQVGGSHWSSVFGNWDTSGNTDGMLLRFKGANVEFFVYENGSSVFSSSGTASGVSTNEWFHIAMTMSTNASGGAVKVYVNGEQKISGTLSGAYNPNSTQDLFMCYGGDIDTDTARYFDGKVGAGRIYSKALSASEIGQNYRHGRDYIYTDLVDDTNLKLHLDAGNTDSYDPSSDGSTWSDLTTGNHDATLTSMNASQHDKEIGGWFDFDGSNDFGTVSHNTNLDLSSSGFTAEAWIYHTDSNLNMLLDKGTVSRGYGYNLQINANNLDLRIHATGGTGATIKILGTETLTANQWNHVAFTVSDLSSSATAITYVNGVQDDTDSGNLTSYTNTSNLLIGSSAYNTTDRFDGKIGQVRIYSNELTADEVMQNYLFTKNDYPNSLHKSFAGITFNSGTPDYFEFDGTSADYVTLDDVTNSNVKHDSLGAFTGETTKDWTISFYIRTSDTEAGNTNMGMTILGTNASYVYASIGIKDNKLCFAGYDTAWYQRKSTTSINDGEWHFCTIVNRSDETMDIYVDGTKEADNVGSALYSGRYLVINTIGQGWSSRYLDMDFGQLKIYDRAMTSSEVTAAFNLDKSTYGL